MAKTLEQKVLTKFNQITGLLLRGSNEANTTKIAAILKQQGEDNLLNFAEDWVMANPNPNGDTAMLKFYAYAIAEYARGNRPNSKIWVHGKRVGEPARVVPMPEPETKPETKEEPKPATSSTAESQASGFLNDLGNLLVKTVAESKTTEIIEAVKKATLKEVEAFVHENYGVLPKKVVIETDGVKREIKGVTHEKFEQVLDAVHRGINVFLVGGAGSGKNVLCEQVAEALGLDFYMSNAVTQEYKITGFTDANGVYQETPFYKAWTKGGLFMLDEVDASIADVLVTINAALSNGYQDFPAPIGNVKKHKDFHVIAAGNTYGLGADYDYVGRNVIDAATRNRFFVEYIDYSPKIEEQMANGDKDLLAFCRDFRNTCKKLGVRAIMSYRNIRDMANLSSSPFFSKADIVEGSVTSGLKYDDLNMINNEMTVQTGAWKEAFNGIVRKARANG